MDKWENFNLPQELREVILKSPSVVIPESREQLLELALGSTVNTTFEVAYEVPERGRVVEATVAYCKNGAVVNFTEPYMRRRDPDCMVVGDNGITDKPTYKGRFGTEFETVRQATFSWLAEQELIVMPFMAGGREFGKPALLVAPRNAGFFAGGLADLQPFISRTDVEEDFTPTGIVYVAPPFRHTHYYGKQVVVHNRTDDIHEVFSYNLYPGPSAKKGIYGMLLNRGEKEGWVTLHASTVQVVTPYDNTMVIMHEGASGGGKSEMLEPIHRQEDGLILVAENTVSDERFRLELKEASNLHPVTDDMALVPPSLQENTRKLIVQDAEDGWFLRINHITAYGTDPHLEKQCVHPKEPLIFLNLQGVPNSTCLIWEHYMDAPDKPCPNPRVIMPRRLSPNVVDGSVEVDVRSFGVRTPPCTSENPTFGIIGIVHILPPALAWLWRLVAPRGHDNPSITDTEGMTSEGVGSYWPFATGRMVDQANLLLDQFVRATGMRYILTPNQHVGCYKVGFNPEWLTREYLSRRGSARFRPDQLTPARSSLLGYALTSLKIDGTPLPKGLLQVDRQPEVGRTAYDKGASILSEFFKRELEKFVVDDLEPLGRQIIECCLNDGSLDDYQEFIPIRF